MARRRPPPSPLMLVPGLAPPRSHRKHPLPSVPRPTFHAPGLTIRGPASSPRRKGDDLRNLLAQVQGSGSSPALSTYSPPSSRSSSPSQSPKRVRGPWDHSGCITSSFRLEIALAPLKPVALVGGDRNGWTREEL